MNKELLKELYLKIEKISGYLKKTLFFNTKKFLRREQRLFFKLFEIKKL